MGTTRHKAFLQHLKDQAKMKSVFNIEFNPRKPFNSDESSSKGVLLQHYTSPTNNDLHVIIPFFNPCNSIRIVQNLLLVKSKLDVSKIPYIIIHCLHPDSNAILESSATYTTVESKSYMFCKENLFNIAISQFGEGYKKYMLLDSDVIFESPTWYDEASKMLDTYDVIQPYTSYKSLHVDFMKSIRNGQSTFSSPQNGGSSHFIGHPGYAIALTHAYILAYGFPDIALIGGGDALFAMIVCGKCANDTRDVSDACDANFTNMSFQAVYKKYAPKSTIKYGALSGTV